jgi:hypothetical protein
MTPRPVQHGGGVELVLAPVVSDDAILLARQFRDCLRDRVDHFIGFRGIDFV